MGAGAGILIFFSLFFSQTVKDMGCGSSTPHPNDPPAEDDGTAAEDTVAEDSSLLACHLSSILNIPEGNQTIKTYVTALQEEGYDNPEDFDRLTLLELEGGFVFKKGHVKKVRGLVLDVM